MTSLKEVGEKLFIIIIIQNKLLIPPAGSQATHHWHHQQEGRVAGDGDVGRLQYHHSHPQHLHWGAASRCFRGITVKQVFFFTVHVVV